MDPLARYLITLPVTLPMLAFATWLDFVLAPVSHKLDDDYPAKVAEAAFEIMGV